MALLSFRPANYHIWQEFRASASKLTETGEIKKWSEFSFSRESISTKKMKKIKVVAGKSGCCCSGNGDVIGWSRSLPGLAAISIQRPPTTGHSLVAAEPSLEDGWSFPRPMKLRSDIQEKDLGDPTEKWGLIELAQSCGTQRHCARAKELHLFTRNPRQRDFPQSWGLGSNLVSLVPCLCDALGAVWGKKIGYSLTSVAGTMTMTSFKPTHR